MKHLVIILLIFTNFQQMSEIDRVLSLENETDIILGIGQLLWDKTKDDENLESLNQFEKNVLFLDMLEGQVNNGGFDQYFFNSSGEYAHETLTALEEIGAYKTAELLEQAIKVFPQLPIPKDTEQRRELMKNLPQQVSDVWGQLDDEFYEYPDNIAGLAIEYVKNNKKQFE